MDSILIEDLADFTEHAIDTALTIQRRRGNDEEYAASVLRLPGYDRMSPNLKAVVAGAVWLTVMVMLDQDTEAPR